MVRYLILAAAAALAACSPTEAGNSASQSSETASAETATPTKHPTSGLQIIEVTVMRGGKPIVFKTEVANTPEAQARGMMFRTEMADDEAMLFPSRVPAQRSFWMKNTPLSLDIIFVGVDGRISNIGANAVPYSTESVPSVGLASAVFEIRGGLSEELGIVPGDRLIYELPE